MLIHNPKVMITNDRHGYDQLKYPPVEILIRQLLSLIYVNYFAISTILYNFAVLYTATTAQH